MIHKVKPLWWAGAVLFLACSLTATGALPPKDERAGTPKTVDTLRTFPEISSRAEWEARANEIREQILVSCGLWPLPEKTPIKAEIFSRIERDDYSVEKVYFQSYPNFYVTGNLYRPLGKGQGPFPGILNPHGHWANGRLADTKDGSIAARCISFARMGMVAFSWDMIGYNDSTQLGPHRQIATNRANLLWNISLMGLQTWNSIRALDFLESLPFVDKSRLACTGESGGGTQTFMLGGVDDRLAAQAPIVMVSHSMQGGCLCENAPGLRVDYSNMEIAARPVPRPQILVAATGDWTKATLTVEGPAIEKIYRLFGAADKLRYVRFDFDHNYNQTSREAVYQFFGKSLLNSDAKAITEPAYQKEPDNQLLVWSERELPSDAVTEAQLLSSIIEKNREQLQRSSELLLPSPSDRLLRAVPKRPAPLGIFKKTFTPLWKHTLQVDLPERDLIVERVSEKKSGDYNIANVAVGRAGKHDRLPVILITPEKDTYKFLALLVHPKGKAAYLDTDGRPQGLAKELLDRHNAVLLVDTFLTGELADEKADAARKHFSSFFSTYNRTDLQERVQDIMTVCGFGQMQGKGRRVVICGEGRAGLWALLAAPAGNAVVADWDGLDESDDSALLSKDLFTPGLRKLGGFQTAALLAAPHPLLVHNTGEKFSATQLGAAYTGASAALLDSNKDAASLFKSDTEKLKDTAIADWIGTLK